MNNVYVLTPDFKLEGIIDECVSIIWRPSYSEVGDFEIYLGATEKAINLLQENRYVVRSSDISVTNYSGKNLLPYPYAENTKTANGITFTVNDDGSININGTASANTFFNLSDYTKGNFLLKNDTYTLSINSKNVPIWVRSETNTGIVNTKGSVNFTVEKEEAFGVFLRIPSGTKVENETVYPMIRKASVTNDTYEPYTGGAPKTLTTYEKVMVIKNIQLITDVENGDFLCVTGRELKYLFHQRIVWKQTNLTGNTENAIRRLVTENAISPTDSKRIIPNLALGVAAGLTETIDKQVTGEYLDVAIAEICITYNYGWDVFITNNTLVFVVYAGSDRSYEQTERPYVVFSDEFENLYNTDYQLFTEAYANATLVGGEGEGVQRVYTTVNNGVSGLQRFETFTDARDISQNKGSEDEIDATTYLNLLIERGRENLASLNYTEGFTGEVLSDVAFKYNEDFFIGDIVTVINKYGIQKNVRVLSAIESESEDGVKLLPQFSI